MFVVSHHNGKPKLKTNNGLVAAFLGGMAGYLIGEEIEKVSHYISIKLGF